MNNKIKFTTKRPRRSGTYIVQYEDDDFDIISLYYCDEGKDWWLFDYPNSNTSEPLEDDSGISWGPKLEEYK